MESIHECLSKIKSMYKRLAEIESACNNSLEKEKKKKKCTRDSCNNGCKNGINQTHKLSRYIDKDGNRGSKNTIIFNCCGSITKKYPHPLSRVSTQKFRTSFKPNITLLECYVDNYDVVRNAELRHGELMLKRIVHPSRIMYNVPRSDVQPTRKQNLQVSYIITHNRLFIEVLEQLHEQRIRKNYILFNKIMCPDVRGQIRQYLDV
jgi:hypothetical protein